MKTYHRAQAIWALLLGASSLGCSAGADHSPTSTEASNTGGSNTGGSGVGGSTPSGGAGGISATGGTSGTGGAAGGGTFLARKRRIAVGDGTACAIAPDRTIASWGADFPPSGSDFDAVSAENSNYCGRRLDGTISCWSSSALSPLTSPTGIYGDFDVGGYYACALRLSDGMPECWGNPNSIPAGAPQQSFVEIEASTGNVCARGTDGSIVCWGDNYNGLATPPSGSFTQLGLSPLHGCALKTTGTTQCWGNAQFVTPAPTTVLLQIAAGGVGTCGIRPDQSVYCWTASNLTSPAGTFVEVAAGNTNACGIHENGIAECWPPIQFMPADFKALL